MSKEKSEAIARAIMEMLRMSSFSEEYPEAYEALGDYEDDIAQTIEENL